MIEGLTSVVIPTTGRKDMAVNKVIQTIETAGDNAIEVICVVDADPASCEALRELTSKYPVQVICEDKYHGAPVSWNKGLKLSQGEFVVLGTDDGWPAEGWLDASLEAMKQLPEGGGLVGFNDEHWDKDTLFEEDVFATSGLYTRRFILDYMGGCLAFECYRHWCNDTEGFWRAKNAGRYIWAENAIVRHDHPNWKTREIDATDERNSVHHTRDLAIFMQRQGQGFPNNFEPAITE